MFGSEDAMIRLDMAEFMDRHTVSRLVGAPAGYVGYDEGGQLTEAVRRRSYCAILLDEIEKAHPEVFNILLQIFDDGHLTDAKCRKVDFRNTIIVMTSNIGSDLIKRDSGLGFAVKTDEAQTDSQQYERMKDKVMDEVKRFFRPEFLNRIDGTVVFHALGKDHILNIVDLMLNSVKDQLKAKDDSGTEYSFSKKEFRVQLERLEDYISFELNSGKGNHIRYIDFRYNNAIAVYHS